MIGRRGYRHRNREAGYSLIEIVVGMSVLTLILGGVYGAIDLFQAQAVTATNDFTAVSQGQLLVEAMTKDIRAAVPLSPTQPAFSAASDYATTFYSNLGDVNGPDEISISLTPSGCTTACQIVGTKTPADAGSAPNYTYTIGPTVNQFTGQYVNVSGGTPIFRYCPTNDNCLATPSDWMATPVTGTSNLQSIEEVEINLSTQVTLTSSPTTITTQVLVRNVAYNPNGS